MRIRAFIEFNTTAKIKVFLSLSGLLGISQIQAQQSQLDTINIDPTEKELRLSHPEITFSKPLDFTDTQVMFEHQKLNFSRAQTPSKTTILGFGSQGIFQFKPNLILSGKLKVESENESEVPYILTEERTTNQNFISNPAYFYAPRKSDWLRQNYYINGNLAYNPWKGLLIGAEVEGSFLKAYSSRDPRPEIGNYEYHLDAKLGYKLKNHSLFVKAGYFNRQKRSKISYSNTNLNAPNHFDTYIRFNRGYGNYYYNDTFGDVEYQYDGVSFGAEYLYETQKNVLLVGYKNEFYIDRLTRFYTYQIRDENNVLRTFRDIQKIAGLRTDKHQIYARYLGNIGNWKWSSKMDFVDQEDLNYDYQGLYTSYKALNQNLSWQNYFSRWNSKNELLRLGGHLTVGNQNVKDLSVVMNKKLQFLDYQISGEKEFRLKQNQKIALEVRHGLYLPLDSKMIYEPYQSSQENIFVKNIVIPDYFYDSSTRLNLGIQLKYFIDLKRVRYEVYAKGQQWYFVNNRNGQEKGNINTDASQYVSLGFNFYY